MPSKIRKRRFPTGSSSSFANNSLAQFLVEKSGSPEKCEKPGGDDRVVEVLDRLSMNVGRSRNMNRSSPSRGLANEVCLVIFLFGVCVSWSTLIPSFFINPYIFMLTFLHLPFHCCLRRFEVITSNKGLYILYIQTCVVLNCHIDHSYNKENY